MGGGSSRDRRVALLAGLACVSVADPASAAAARSGETADAPEGRPLALEGTLGVGTPVGFAGAWLDYAPVSPLSLAAGIGANASGPQYAFMVRARFPGRAERFYVGLGASMGAHRQQDLPLGADGPSVVVAYRWNRAYWANLELGFEHVFSSGVILRPYVGLAYLLNHAPTTTEVIDDGGFADPLQRSPVEFVLPYFGMAVGWAF